MTLPYDYARCLGVSCPQRGQCARWLSWPIDAPRLSVVNRLCQSDQYEFFVPSEEVHD